MQSNFFLVVYSFCSLLNVIFSAVNIYTFCNTWNGGIYQCVGFFKLTENAFLTELSLGLNKRAVFSPPLVHSVTSFCYLCFRFANDYESLWVLLESYFVECFL